MKRRDGHDNSYKYGATKGSVPSVVKIGDANRSNSKPQQAAKNVIVPNALTPVQLSWNVPKKTTKKKETASPRSILVHQSPDDATWPGGAVWDLGWSLAHVMIALSNLISSSTTHTQTGTDSITTTTTMHMVENDSVTQQQYHIRNNMNLPSRVTSHLQQESIFQQQPNEGIVVLELGCGTGLTGLVCAVAFAERCPTTVLLTDLSAVVDQITSSNLQRNAKSTKKIIFPLREEKNIDENETSPLEQLRPLYIHTISQQGRVLAVPLCWGDGHDIRTVQSVIRHLRTYFRNTNAHPSCQSPRNLKPKFVEASSDECSCPQPDFILVGDVAYQQQPGAPSHFDALVLTILQFTSPETILIFGQRVRMAASMDLYLQLLEHFDEIVAEPISPQEIDPIRFQNVKPNTMTIHFFKRKENDKK